MGHAERKVETDQSSGAARPRLLIVDDVPDNRLLLAKRFERRGFEIIEADDGAQALSLIDQGGFDLVLLDIAMPGLDGIEVLRRIREMHSPLSLPVIMVTGNAQSMSVVEALNGGANDYITKPVDFPVALARVDTQIGRSRAEEALQRRCEALARANAELEREIAELRAQVDAG